MTRAAGRRVARRGRRDRRHRSASAAGPRPMAPGTVRSGPEHRCRGRGSRRSRRAPQPIPDAGAATVQLGHDRGRGAGSERPSGRGAARPAARRRWRGAARHWRPWPPRSAPVRGTAGRHASARRHHTAAATASRDPRYRARTQPSLVSVPVPEAVDQRHRPAGVRRPVDGPPGPVADPASQQAGDDQGDQQVGRHRAETEPEGAVGRAERDDGVEPADRREAVDDRRGDVDAEEHDRQQREVPVQTGRDEPGPARASSSRLTSSTPSRTLAVSSTSATSPVPRVMYHRALAEPVAQPASITDPPSAGPSADGGDLAVGARPVGPAARRPASHSSGASSPRIDRRRARRCWRRRRIRRPP